MYKRQAVDNTVTLYDTASFAGSDLYGGKTDGTSSDVFTGNTLNLHGQIQADSLQNFQNLNFSDVADGTPSADLAKSAVLGDGKGSFTNVSIQNLRNQSGDVPEEYVLVHTPAASSRFTGTNLYVNGADTVTLSLIHIWQHGFLYECDAAVRWCRRAEWRGGQYR